MTEPFKVRTYGHSVPLAYGTCANCGRPVKYNLSGGSVIAHVDDGGVDDCRDPWPALGSGRAYVAPAGLAGQATLTLRPDDGRDQPLPLGAGIVTAVPTWTGPGDANLLDDIRAAMDLLDRAYERQPAPACVEVDDLATAVALAGPVGQAPWRPAMRDPFGIPVVTNPDLPAGTVRVLDAGGNVLHQGRL